jgi:predicted CXXCH cytochrome family protein
MLKVVLMLPYLIGMFPVDAAADDNKEPSGYIGSGKCSACHPEQYTAWKTSRHAVGSVNSDGSENPSAPDQGWIKNCAGCHTTDLNAREFAWNEKGAGCEACHGPGRDHVSGMGDKGKIVSSGAADICGQCHAGNQSGSGLMTDGAQWIVGYRPGMKLSDVPGLQISAVDPDKLPPPPINNHPLTYNMWKASGHGKASGRTFTIGGKDWSGPITCVACHNPHHSDYPQQLVTEPEKLCGYCHSQNAVLKGKGARGVEDTRSLHTAISCIECHMTEGNHLMRIIRPDNPDLPEDRTDTCSACHEAKDRKIRAHQIQDWQAWYREALEPVQADMQIIDDALKNNPNLLNAGLKKKLEDTKANLSLIKQDGSEGVHNLDYALEILSLAKKDLAGVKAAIE